MLEQTLRTRADEGGRDGNLPVSTLLRYFEHLRWEGLRLNYAGMQELITGERLAVVRAQEIEILQPIRAGETGVFRLWTERVGRTSATFGHTIRSESGELLARCAVVWVHLTREGTPVALPAHVVASPTGEVPSMSMLTESVPTGAWSYRYAVRASEVDVLQHVNHASYVRYVEDTLAFGEQYRAWGARTAWAQRSIGRLAIDYRAETHLGSDVEVKTWVGEDDAFHFALSAGRTEVGRARVVTRR